MLNDTKLTKGELIQKISECKRIIMNAEQRMVYADSPKARRNDMVDINFYRKRVNELSVLLDDLQQTNI